MPGCDWTGRRLRAAPRAQRLAVTQSWVGCFSSALVMCEAHSCVKEMALYWKCCARIERPTPPSLCLYSLEPSSEQQLEESCSRQQPEKQQHLSSKCLWFPAGKMRGRFQAVLDTSLSSGVNWTWPVRESRSRRWTWARQQKQCHLFEKDHSGEKFMQLWCALGSCEHSWGFPGDLRTSFSSGVSLTVF